MWLFYCLLGTFISGFTAIAMKKCSNNEPKIIVVQGLLIYCLLAISICLLTETRYINMLNIKDMIYILPATIFQIVGFYCAIVSTKFGKVSIIAPIKKARVVVVFLLGIIILHESCSFLQLILSILLVTLSVVLVWEKDSKNIDSVLARKAAIYAYGFAIFNGIYGFLNKIYVTHFDDGLYVLFTNCITMILILSIYCLITNNKKYLNINKVNNKKYLLLYGLFDVFYGVFNRLSLETGNVSVISVIETSSIIVTVIASRIILKEKLSWKKYAIIMIMFLCVFMLALIKT